MSADPNPPHACWKCHKQWHLFFLLTIAPIATFMVVLKLNPPDGV
jgi:hypothetical protein